MNSWTSAGLSGPIATDFVGSCPVKDRGTRGVFGKRYDMYNFHIAIILRVWYVYIIILIVLYKVVIRFVIITQTNRNFVINRTINNFNLSALLQIVALKLFQDLTVLIVLMSTIK
jgi:hypothetical protein